MIYIAGPFFNEAQREFLDKIQSMCKELKLKTYLPYKDGGVKNKNNSNEIFQKNIENLDKSNLVIAYLTMPEMDTGTAFELGYAYSKNIKIMAILDDIRFFNKEQLNLMIEKSVKIVKSLDELKEALEKYVD
ncbi:MAG TPA: nucleoside 2-deoxyribosyltransferase [Candidatus Nanoarchaeia archaeon]|nr:nucleoside 2-deoxyribosyltransferase [Candidatus Nanoarchaeia archaeon]